MVKLNELFQAHESLPLLTGIKIFRMILNKYAEDPNQNQRLEGLSPTRISINDNWEDEVKTVKILPAKGDHTNYAYYAPEYLDGNVWDEQCTVFSLCSIIYRAIFGELPYLGNVPEELLNNNTGLRYIQKTRFEVPLELFAMQTELSEIFARGLAPYTSLRYDSLSQLHNEHAVYLEYFENFGILEEALESDTNDTPSEIEDAVARREEIFKAMSSVDHPEGVAQLDIHKETTGGLDDLAGLQDIKQYLRQHVQAILDNPQKAKKYNLTIPNGLLLYGPPGCGKTTIAQKFAAECRINCAVVNSMDIASTLVHGTEKLVRQIFDQAEKNAPIILVFDEIETMVPDRSCADFAKVAEDTNAFLTQLNTCAQRGIFVIGTTNRPSFMDSAILRSGRFDKKLFVPLPDSQTREILFEKYLTRRPVTPHIDYHYLSELTTGGYISSDIKQICDEASTEAFIKNELISQDLLQQVIQRNGPSVSHAQLKTYEASRRVFDTSRAAQSQYRIGF